jgi:hypothetical protein
MKRKPAFIYTYALLRYIIGDWYAMVPFRLRYMCDFFEAYDALRDSDSVFGSHGLQHEMKRFFIPAIT